MSSIRAAATAVLPDRPDLVAEVELAYASGTAAWPQVHVRPEALALRILARARATDPELADDAAPRPTSHHHDQDLYLAVALGEGDTAALAVFEAELVPEIDAALARMRLASSLCNEVRQAVRVELLVRDGDVARIDGYLGLGPLAAWLRVTATRRALKLLRRTAREEKLDDVVVASWPDSTPDPSRNLLAREYGGHLKSAIAEALASLTVRERNMLKQHVLDELTLDELALLYRVHRSTCARWLVDARATLARATRRALSDRLGREGQLDSILRFVESDLELSLSRILRD